MLLSLHLLSFSESHDVILSILGSSHGLGASLEEYEKYKIKKAPVGYCNNAILVIRVSGEVSPPLVFLSHAPRGEKRSGDGQLPFHLPEMG